MSIHGKIRFVQRAQHSLKKNNREKILIEHIVENVGQMICVNAFTRYAYLHSYTHHNDNTHAHIVNHENSSRMENCFWYTDGLNDEDNEERIEFEMKITQTFIVNYRDLWLFTDFKTFMIAQKCIIYFFTSIKYFHTAVEYFSSYSISI